MFGSHFKDYFNGLLASAILVLVLAGCQRSDRRHSAGDFFTDANVAELATGSALTRSNCELVLYGPPPVREKQPHLRQHPTVAGVSERKDIGNPLALRAAGVTRPPLRRGSEGQRPTTLPIGLHAGGHVLAHRKESGFDANVAAARDRDIEALAGFTEESKMGQADASACPQGTAVHADSHSTRVDESQARTEGTSTIMIVDDEPVNIAVTRKYLKLAGYVNFVVTTDPTRALELARREDPDVVLLDIVMPGMSGLAVLKQLRADSALTRLPIIILTADCDPATKRQAFLWGATDFLNKPANPAELAARVRNVLTVKQYHDHLASHAQELERRVQQRAEELAACRQEVIQCLARAAECRTDVTKQHSIRVSEYAGVIAEGLGMDDRAVESLKLATLLHDVGKIGFPDAALDPAGELSLEERELLEMHGVVLPADRCPVENESAVYASHTIAGSRIMAVGKWRVLEMAASIAMSHHEKWDGSGYPFGMAGARIPLEARIVAVANAFDLLSTKKRRRPAFSNADCLAIMADGEGKHFDPQVIEAFLRKWPEIQQTRERYFVSVRQP